MIKQCIPFVVIHSQMDKGKLLHVTLDDVYTSGFLSSCGCSRRDGSSTAVSPMIERRKFSDVAESADTAVTKDAANQRTNKRDVGNSTK